MTKRIEFVPFCFKEIVKLYKWKLPELSVILKGMQRVQAKKRTKKHK